MITRRKLLWLFPLAAVAALAGLVAALTAAACGHLIEHAKGGAVTLASLLKLSALFIPLGQVLFYTLWFVPTFLIVWLVVNLLMARRTGKSLLLYMLADLPLLLIAAPLVGILAAFGPADPPLRQMDAVRVGMYLLLFLKVLPFLKTTALTRTPGWREVALGLAAIYLSFFLIDHPRPLAGDEPHYLVMAHSLSHDADLDLRDDYRSRDISTWFRGALMPDTHVTPGPQGRWAPTHYPGMPLLIAAPLRILGPTACKLVGIGCAVLGLTCLFHLLLRLGLKNDVAARAVVLLACSSPLMTYAVHIYPEIVAGGLLAVGMMLLMRAPLTWRSALWVSLIASALPWLHVRYAPLSVALAVGVLLRSRERKVIASLVLPALISLAGLLLFYRAIYGGFLPGRVSALPEGYSYLGALSLKKSATYLCAMFFDSQGGLIAYAPGLMLAPLGVAILWRRDRVIFAVALIAALGEMALIAAGWRSWHGDWAPPSRFLACVAPVFLLWTALAYQRALRNRALRRICHLLFAVGLLLGFLMLVDPDALYNLPTPWSRPAIDREFLFMRLEWIWPNYAAGGTGAYVRTALVLAHIAALTWAVCRFGREKREAVDASQASRV